MKVKKCPICAEEILNADSGCPQCGKIHYQTGGASFFDRESKKNIALNYTMLYVTDKLFALDKGETNILSAGGAAGFGVAGALVGGLMDEAIHAAKRAAKKKITAICHSWESVASLTYPMEPLQMGLFGKPSVGNGIDVKLKDGTVFFIFLRAFGKDGAKELYGVMNRLHQDRVARTLISQENHVASAAIHIAAASNESPKISINRMAVQPEFFKCSFCGVTQMRDGKFCIYCGKPAPRSEQGEQKATGNSDITCPSCGNVQKTGDKFCFRCGRRLAEEPSRKKYCPDCGVEVKDGMLFCVECGTKL